ncbi:MAG: hypothetical protein MUF64_10655 [Polyangiaceae bacterium]|nr:hypothetical protein [Polyangiaceae bacterium]
MVRPRGALLGCLAALVAGACEPTPEDRAWLVSSPRVLAVISDPAEVAPGAQVRLRSLVLGPDGPVEAPLRWGRCARRKPLTELGPVDPDCMLERPGAWVALGESPTVELVVPGDACNLFGSERPDPRPGQPAGRPVDPDPSGGYFFPVVLALSEQRSLASVRLSCNLSGATQQSVVDYGRRFRPNQNPEIEALSLTWGDQAVQAPADGSLLEVPPATELLLSARWGACPEAPVCGDGVCLPDEETSSCPADCAPLRGCGGAERHVFYDVASRSVLLRREALRASWFSTGGALQREEIRDDQARAALRSPGQPGDFWVAVVLRDDRGGVTARVLHLRVP